MRKKMAFVHVIGLITPTAV